MSRLNTLYLRLALVLVLALGAGFATMGWIFHQHDRDAQGPVFDRHLSAQILLVERLLAVNPAADLSGLPGLEISLSEPPSAGLEPRLPPGLQQRLAKDLGRVLDLRPAVATPGHDGPAGNWLRLQTTPPRWLLLRPPSHPPGPAPWTWGMLVAFGVVLVGGMARSGAPASAGKGLAPTRPRERNKPAVAAGAGAARSGWPGRTVQSDDRPPASS